MRKKNFISTLFFVLFFLYPSISYCYYCNECYSWDCLHERRMSSSSDMTEVCEEPCVEIKGCLSWFNNCFNFDLLFRGYVEYLYWNVLEGETDYMVKNVPNEGTATVATIGDIVSANFNFNSGFRVGGIVKSRCSSWEIDGSYTSYGTDGKNFNELSSDATTIFNGTFAELTSTSPTKITSKIQINTDIWNLIAARRFFLCSDFEARLLMGISGAFLNQDWKFSYVGTNTNNYHLKWNFTGTGLRFGAEGVWNVIKNFGIIGKFSTALFYGSYVNEGKMVILVTDEDPQLFYDFSLEQQRIVPHLQLSFGPQYKINWKCWEMDIYALYEINLFDNIHYVLQSESGRSIDGKDARHMNSMTGSQGLTLGFKLAF
mgnify:CR=1 FL=1